MGDSTDLVGEGLVQSLARPGGNIMGLSLDTGHDIVAKRIQLLNEAGSHHVTSGASSIQSGTALRDGQILTSTLRTGRGTPLGTSPAPWRRNGRQLFNPRR